MWWAGRCGSCTARCAVCRAMAAASSKACGWAARLRWGQQSTARPGRGTAASNRQGPAGITWEGTSRLPARRTHQGGHRHLAERGSSHDHPGDDPTHQASQHACGRRACDHQVTLWSQIAPLTRSACAAWIQDLSAAGELAAGWHGCCPPMLHTCHRSCSGALGPGDGEAQHRGSRAQEDACSRRRRGGGVESVGG